MITLPNSSIRRTIGFLKLLRRVAPDATSGFHYEGETLKPGAHVAEEQLWPALDYPAVPLILEMAQTRTGGRGKNPNPATHILWRYESAKTDWTEIVRCDAYGLEWVPIITPAAVRALRESGSPYSRPDLAVLIQAISRTIEDRLFTLEQDERLHILGALHDYFAVRKVLAHQPWSHIQMDMNPYFCQFFRTENSVCR